MLVFAYAHGGAMTAGVVALAQLASAARRRPGRVLVALTGHAGSTAGAETIVNVRLAETESA